LISLTKEQLKELRKNYRLSLRQESFRQGMSVSTVLGNYEYVRANRCKYLPSNNGRSNVSQYFCEACEIECCDIKQKPSGDPVILEHA